MDYKGDEITIPQTKEGSQRHAEVSRRIKSLHLYLILLFQQFGIPILLTMTQYLIGVFLSIPFEIKRVT